MIGVCLIPFMVVALIILFRIFRAYFKSLHLDFLSIGAAVFLFGGLAAVLGGFLLPAEVHAILSFFKRLLTRAGFYWMGIMLYLLLILLLCALVRIILKVCLKERYPLTILRHLTAVIAIVFTVLMSTVGITNAHRLHVTEYETPIDKESRLADLDIILIADTHLGYNITVKQVADMVELINAQDPDLVLIAGDIFDNEYEAIEDPEKMISLFSQIQSRYGVYGVWGNHDIQEKILMGFTFSWLDKEKHVVKADDRMVDFVERAGIRMLYDEWVEIEDILLYGRPDKEKINFGNTVRAKVADYMKDIDTKKPIIVLDHEPEDAVLLSEHQADLYLNGHTHAGQMWPGTWTIHLFWDNAYGLKRYGDLYNIVTSGVGLFGANMRVGSLAEICRIHVTFR